MQVEEITQILRESPSVRLIKSRSVDFFLSFVIEAFEGQAAIMQERLHMLLENRLDEQENTLVEDDSEMTRLVESNEQKAKRLIKDWTDKGILDQLSERRGRGDIRDFVTHKQIDRLGGELEKEDYIGTESKFKTLFSQLKELVEYSNEDREKRLELLRTKKNGDRASDSAAGDGRRGRGLRGLPDRTTIQQFEQTGEGTAERFQRGG